MADIPQDWQAYARLQKKLSETSCVTIGSALEEALNVVHDPNFRPDAVLEADLRRIAASAARQDRHRQTLRRLMLAENLDGASWVSEDGDVAHASSLDDYVHARRELARLFATLREADWELLIGVASGDSYDDLAEQCSSTPSALRSRVCRLRQVIAPPADRDS